MTETSDVSDRVPSVSGADRCRSSTKDYSASTTFLQKRWFSAVSVQK
jgi:hypothetical protein